jgi:hypothetical protein
MAASTTNHENVLRAHSITVTPAGGVAADDVQAAIVELDADKASVIGAGDVEITATAAGLILRTPNGTRKRIKVANDGTLSTETVV